MSWIKKILFAILFVLAGLGIWSVYHNYANLTSHKTSEQSTILLEKVQKVIKLVAVEGQFAEIYNYKDYIGYDIWPLRKSALIRVNATVSVGYDLESMTITKDDDAKIIKVSDFPSPQILSIDHDLEYYDMQQGIFNVITTQDVTDMSAKAKEFIKDKAEKSILFEKVEEQKKETIQMLEYILENTGWKLEIATKKLKN